MPCWIPQFVSFKAGRCDIEDKGNSKFMVTPDRRKGLLILCKVSSITRAGRRGSHSIYVPTN